MPKPEPEPDPRERVPWRCVNDEAPDCDAAGFAATSREATRRLIEHSQAHR